MPNAIQRMRSGSVTGAVAVGSVSACWASSAALAGPAAGFFQPDSATATSEFSSAYDIGNTIDGSGMPPSFSPQDAHDDYGGDNHWTTRINVMPATASFGFGTPQDMNAMVLWNHRSNIIAANSTYEVTRFDLTLRDDQDAVLLTMTDVPAQPDTPTGQVFTFAPQTGVASVEFVITSNQTLDNGAVDSSFTGFAEIAFASDFQAAFLPGDYNDSGQVEQGDLDLVLSNWGVDSTAGIPAGWDNDLPDGLIEQAELDKVLTNWGSAAPDFTGHTLPEPAGLVSLAGLLTVCGRRATRA